MSVYLDVSNFPVGKNARKYKYFDEFERLIALNQDFISNNACNSTSLPTCSTTLEFINNGHQECGSQVTEESALPKRSNIGNFNVYNRCVFFVNNSGGNGHLENQFKLNHMSAIRRDVKVLSSNRNEAEECLSDSSDNKRKENDFKLWYLHKTSLRPVLSSDIKSGIYKRYFAAKNTSPVPAPSKCNVCLSSSTYRGEVLNTKDFGEKYVRIGNDCFLKNKQTKFAVQYAPQMSDSVLDNESFEDEPRSEFEEYDSCIPNTHDDKVLLITNGSNIIINRESNKITCKSPESGKEVVFKVIHPNLVELESAITSDNRTFDDSTKPCTLKSGVSLLKASRRAHQRKKMPKSQTTEMIPEQPMISSVTRYGRVSKPPKHIQSAFKLLAVSEDLEKQRFHSDNDQDYKCSREILPDTCFVPDPSENRPKRKRELPPNYTCSTCNKIYLGRKMNQHLETNPSHSMKTNSKKEKNAGKLSLYKFLVEKVKQTSEEHRTEVFLTEIADLVNQLQLRGSRFVRNTSGVHFVNSQISKVLGIPEGHYSIDISAIDSTPEAESSVEESSHSVVPPPPPRLDYNLSISLDDTISDAKLNLPDNVIPSEESLMRTVDALVEQGINNLSHDNSVMHYDHASDNAVEAAPIKVEEPPPILDLSLDLFQFNSN